MGGWWRRRLHSDSAWYMGSGSFNSSTSKVPSPLPEHCSLILVWGIGMNKAATVFLLPLMRREHWLSRK